MPENRSFGRNLDWEHSLPDDDTSLHLDLGTSGGKLKSMSYPEESANKRTREHCEEFPNGTGAHSEQRMRSQGEGE